MSTEQAQTTERQLVDAVLAGKVAQGPPSSPISDEEIDKMAQAAAKQVMDNLMSDDDETETTETTSEETEPEVDTSGIKIFSWFRAAPRATRRGLVKGTGYVIHKGRRIRDHHLPHLNFREVMAVLTQMAFVMAATAITVSIGTWAWAVSPVIGTILLALITASIVTRAASILWLGRIMGPIMADAQVAA